jgi:hypothetical protein
MADRDIKPLNPQDLAEAREALADPTAIPYQARLPALHAIGLRLLATLDQERARAEAAEAQLEALRAAAAPALALLRWANLDSTDEARALAALLRGEASRG